MTRLGTMYPLVKARRLVRVVEDGEALSDWLEAEQVTPSDWKILPGDPNWQGAEINKAHLEFQEERKPHGCTPE